MPLVIMPLVPLLVAVLPVLIGGFLLVQVGYFPVLLGTAVGFDLAAAVFGVTCRFWGVTPRRHI